MAKLTIPASEYEVLAKIALLDKGSESELADALSSISNRQTDLDLDLLGVLTSKVPSISSSDLRAIIRTLASLHQLAKRRGKDVADDIQETIEFEKPFGFPKEAVTTLSQRLKTLLSASSDSFSLVAKVMSVITDQDKIFCGARVLSDLRPVFLDSPDSVSAAAIIHTINISYHCEGKHMEFYAAMNPSDLTRLKEAVERAEKKHKALKDYVHRSGIKYLEDTE